MFEINGPGYPVLSSNSDKMLIPLHYYNFYEVAADSTIIAKNVAEKNEGNNNSI